MVHADVAATTGEVVSDYQTYDLEGLWANRPEQTSLESEIIESLLARTSGGRILEVGVGFGRLSPAVALHASEYVGVDLDVGRLAQARGRLNASRSARIPARWVQANLLHLPLTAGSFDAVALVRVLHHFENLAGLVRNLSGVLRPGGVAVLSYSPRPTVGTLLQDLRMGKDGAPTEGQSRVTFAPNGVVRAASNPFPVYTCDRTSFFRALEAAGMERVAEIGAPENVRGWARNYALRIGALWPQLPLLSQKFVLARKRSTEANGRTPMESILECPSCHTSVDESGPAGDPWEWRCPACGFRVRNEDGIVRAVYFPPGTRHIAPRPRTDPTPPDAAG